MAAEPAYDDFENFNLDGQRNQQQAKWTRGSRFKSPLCRKCLILFIVTVLTVSLILLITRVMKSSETNETVEEFQKQVQMEVSQAMSNVSKKSELEDLNLSIQEKMNQMSSKLQTQISTEITRLLTQISIKLEMLPEPGCQNLQCPHNWIHFNGSCYYFSTKKATWDASQQYCSIHGAKLLVINDQIEQYFIAVESESKRFWIGLTDHNSNNMWHWVDETPYNSTPTFWMPGEPNDLAEGCAHLWTNGLWNDAPCSKEDYFICEKQSHQ
ncbi:hepatic lectin-like [Pristis pectinata]|uniref:hepatic lectin-like n=1 Tax=Pristis pectinata TaxID=685728 RepID=UPI00223D559B|nr:hepatic lectin-like [Pristis pectinata]